MTPGARRSVVRLVLILAGIFLTMLALTAVGLLGRANAQGTDVGDPVDLSLQIYQFIRDGSHLPAVGAALMLAVWGMRLGLAKLHPWFSKPVGGYVVGFVSAGLAFVGPALVAGQPVTVGLLTQAVGTGFAASGKWEGLRDLLSKLKKPPTSTTVALVLGVGVVALLSGCGASARHKALRATYTSVAAAQIGFQEWDKAHTMEIAKTAASAEDGEAKLAAYATARESVLKAFDAVYHSLYAVVVLDDDRSLASAVDAGRQLFQTLEILTGRKWP